MKKKGGEERDGRRVGGTGGRLSDAINGRTRNSLGGGGLGVNMNEPTNQWNIRVRRGEVKAGILLTQDSAGCLKE